MNRSKNLAAACCSIAATVILLVPTTQAEPLKQLFPDRSGPELEYLAAHRCVVDKLGAATAGRNYVISGYNAQAGAREATADELTEGTARLESACHPPAPAPVEAAPTSAPATTTYSAPVASGSGCPASMFPESGTAGYSAYNEASGASGCYQVIESTRQAHCSDLGTDPAGQDACAARICAAQGPGAWAASGANPC